MQSSVYDNNSQIDALIDFFSSFAPQSKMAILSKSLSVFFALFSLASALVLDVHNQTSIIKASAILAHGVQELYNGNTTGVIGKWPFPPYYWWESGGAWGGMMQYWAFTKDESYSNVMLEALLSQLGPNYDFVRAEEYFDTGNDDQAFWVFVAMSAAEYGFPRPPLPAPHWHVIVQNAWEDYVYRWNTTFCGGGLKCTVFWPSITLLISHRAVQIRKCRI